MLTAERMTRILKRRDELQKDQTATMREIRADLNEAVESFMIAISEIGRIYAEDVNALVVENERLSARVAELEGRISLD